MAQLLQPDIYSAAQPAGERSVVTWWQGFLEFERFWLGYNISRRVGRIKLRGNSRKLGNFWSREEEEEDQSRHSAVGEWWPSGSAGSVNWLESGGGGGGGGEVGGGGGGGGAQSGADGYRSNMLLLLFLSVPLLTTRLVGSEEVSVDTDECLRGAKASHGDNPNDELDSFLACVLARLDAVSFPCSRLLLSEFNPNVHPNRYRVCAKVLCKNCHLFC